MPLEGDPVRHTAKTSKTQAGFRGPSSLAVRLFRAPAPVWCVADCDDPDTPWCMFVTAAAMPAVFEPCPSTSGAPVVGPEPVPEVKLTAVVTFEKSCEVLS